MLNSSPSLTIVFAPGALSEPAYTLIPGCSLSCASAEASVPAAYEGLVTARVVKVVMRRDQPGHLGHVSSGERPRLLTFAPWSFATWSIFGASYGSTTAVSPLSSMSLGVSLARYGQLTDTSSCRTWPGRE